MHTTLIIAKFAVKHPVTFTKGIVQGFHRVYTNSRNPDYVKRTPEEAQRVIKESLQTIEKLT